MYAYLDQNVLIYLANNHDWMGIATDALAAERVLFVMSPWHFYEIGATSRERRSELLNVAEQLRPVWIFEKVDLQLYEFFNCWQNFWEGEANQFTPIRTLPEIAAAILRSIPERLNQISLAHYAELFARRGGTQALKETFEKQKTVAAANQLAFHEGRYTDAIDHFVKRRYIARQLAIEARTGPSMSGVDRRGAAILQNTRNAAKIDFFIEFGGMSELRAWNIESRLTLLHMAGNAVLNKNRQVDRRHAIAGLAYCDRLVTNDQELRKRTDEVSIGLPFTPAKVVLPEDFFKQL